MYQSKTFDHNGEQYEVRTVSDGHTVRVRAFKDGKPANGYSYSVEVLTQVDAQGSGSSINPVEALVDVAESDVRAGLWEKYVAASTAASQRGDA